MQNKDAFSTDLDMFNAQQEIIAEIIKLLTATWQFEQASFGNDEINFNIYLNFINIYNLDI